MKPGFGESNLGAMAGGVIGAIGGLFALGIAPAIVTRNPAYIVRMPILGLASLLICGIVGWLLGGQIGPRMAERSRSQRTEIVAGGLAGFIPVIAIALFGWYMARS